MRDAASRVACGLTLVILAFQVWAAIGQTRHDIARREAIRDYRDGEYASALDGLQRASGFEPSDSQTWAWIGDAAQALYDIEGGSALHDGRGIELLDVAWQGYASAVGRSPGDSWSWSGLAEVAVKRSRLTDSINGLDLGRFRTDSASGVAQPLAIALVAASQAVELKPSGYQELDVLAYVHAALGHPKRTLELYATSARMMPAPSFHTWGTGVPIPGGQYAVLIEALTEGIDRAPEFERSMLYLEIGRFAASQRQSDRAYDLAESALAAASNDYERHQALWELSKLAERRGDLESSLRHLRGAMDVTRKDREVLARREGVLLMRLGRFEKACDVLASVCLHTPSDRGTRLDAAGACEAAGDTVRAERLLSVPVEDPERDLPVVRELHAFYVRQGRTRSAENLRTTWAERNSGQLLVDSVPEPSPDAVGGD